MRQTVSILLTGLLLGGCTDAIREFDVPSQTGLEGGGFGTTVQHNTLAMTDPTQFAVSMTRKFATDVQNTVNFAFNSAVLDSSAQATLREQAKWIRQFPEVRFRVFGHTDLVGSDGYNKGLGLRRAQAVVAYLATQGVSRSRLEAVVSYGKTQPLVATPGPNEQNRRTVTEVSGLAGGARQGMALNGKYAAVIFREYVSAAVPMPENQVSSQTSVGSETSSGN